MSDKKKPLNQSGQSGSGVKAEERALRDGMSSYFNNMSSYFQGISSYLPTTLKSIGISSTPASSFSLNSIDDRDPILWMSFDFLDLSNEYKKPILIIGYVNGFQVWDIENPQNIHEVLSRRDFPIKCVKCIPNPLKSEIQESPLYGKRPLLAVVTSGSNSPSTTYSNNVVKLFSLQSGDYVNVLRFKSEVYQVLCSNRILLVVLQDYMYGFDAVTMEKVVSLSIFPNLPNPYSVMVPNHPTQQTQLATGSGMGSTHTASMFLPSNSVALGPRWIAFPGNQQIPNKPKENPGANTSGTNLNTSILNSNTSSGSQGSHAYGYNNTTEKLVEVAKDVAKDIASGLYYLGSKTLNDFVYTSNNSNSTGNPNSDNNNVNKIQHSQVSNSNKKDDMDFAGTVIVYDIVTSKVIAHFQAHSQPIAVLQFDPSGSLLATASIDGHNINIFRIAPNCGGAQYNFKHIYKLQRGVTNAIVQNIAFSADSRWLSVSTTRGTSHLFAINPSGGHVSIHTHLRNAAASTIQPKTQIVFPLQNTELSNNLIVLSALNRVKQHSIEEFFSSKGTPIQLPQLASSCGFPRDKISGTSSSLYVLNQFGILTQYQLRPHPPAHNSDVDPSTLQLQVEPILEWDVCRCSHWSPIADRRLLAIPEEFAYLDKDRNWLANVEIQTHSPLLRPLWASQQFTFKPIPSVWENPENNSRVYQQQKKIEFQQNIPVQQRQGESDNEFSREVISSSAPLEDALKENLLDAMTTHLPLSPVPSLTTSKEQDVEPPFANVPMPMHQTEPVFGLNQQDLPFDDSYFAFSDNSREEFHDNNGFVQNSQSQSNSNLYK